MEQPPNSREIIEVAKVFEPVITTKEWLKTFLLLLIPFANIVFMIIWAVGGEGIPLTRRNMFRAYWIFYVIYIGIIFVLEIIYVIIYLIALVAVFWLLFFLGLL